MKTVGEILSASEPFLQERGVSRARFVAGELVAFALGVKRLDLYLQFDRPLQEEELIRVRPLLRRAGQGEPLEYILGEVEFYATRLKVTPAVLIPRPETELGLDWICQDLKKGKWEEKEAWDVCTGSGCLGIALKKAFPELRVSLSDLSLASLEIAEENAKRNGVCVECLHGHLLEPFRGRKADIIVCNPPYVSEEEYLQLERSVREFEPRAALLGGEDGLLFYRDLKELLPAHLHPGAKIFFEIGSNQGAALKNLFSETWWAQKRVLKDWSGHDRFFFLEFESVGL